MTQTKSNYARIANDHYPTPLETTQVLLDRVRFSRVVCDPCCGKRRRIMKALVANDYLAVGDDFAITKYDFVEDAWPAEWRGVDVVTNPPYGGRSGRLAVKFVVRALEVTRRKVAMLLPVDFDSGSTRQHIFRNNKYFAKKIILLNRVRWFRGASGTTNHAWYVWDKRHKGPPTIEYALQVYPEEKKR